MHSKEELDITETEIQVSFGEKEGKREIVQWSSRFEYVMSMLGQSLGLGDMWRLPYLVYRNGGGAFLIPYACCMIFCGIPMFYMEMSMSQFAGAGPWKIWNICPLLQGIGLSFMYLNWMTATYLSILRAWIIEYLVSSFRSEVSWDSCDNWWNTDKCYIKEFNTTLSRNNYSVLTNSSTSIFDLKQSHLFVPEVAVKVSPTEEFWEHKVLRMSAGLDYFGGINWMYVLYLSVTHVIIIIALAKSVKSIGKLMYVTVLGPILLLLVVWIRALMINGSVSGMLYFLIPDFTHLSKPEVWIEAAFMTMFTLGPGWGTIHALAAHANFKGNCLRDSVIVVMFTLCYGVLNGLVVFSVLGVMSEETGTPINEVLQTGGFSLGFVAYPRAVVYFPLPQIWAAIFFIILLLPSVDVATVFLEPVLCSLEEVLPKAIAKRRILLVFIVGTSSFVATIPFTSKAGVYLFQFMDWYVGTVAITLFCIVEAIAFAWIYGGDRVSRDIHLMVGRPLPHLIRLCVAFVIPVSLLIIFTISIYKYKPPTLGEYRYPEFTNAIGWCISMFALTLAVVYLVVKIAGTKGNLRKRLTTLLHFNSKWRPADPEYIKVFEKSEKEHVYSIKNLLWFNLTGRSDWKYDYITKEADIFVDN